MPPYFQGIESKAQAKAWLDIILAESRLFLVKNKKEKVLGCVFISHRQGQGNYQDKHLGYLLAEEQLGKVLLKPGFTKRCNSSQSVDFYELSLSKS